LSDKATIPSRATDGAAGYDLTSAVDTVVPPHGKALCPTDLSFTVPEGTCGRIAPRSGLAWKQHIDIGGGIIDRDFRGNVGVILFNHSNAELKVSCGDRIAQLIIEKIELPTIQEVEELPTSVRGEGGFGSTGTSAHSSK
jgi:dUTP pyrophosphatase